VRSGDVDDKKVVQVEEEKLSMMLRRQKVLRRVLKSELVTAPAAF
jgi:hypothetical protein